MSPASSPEATGASAHLEVLNAGAHIVLALAQRRAYAETDAELEAINDLNDLTVWAIGASRTLQVSTRPSARRDQLLTQIELRMGDILNAIPDAPADLSASRETLRDWKEDTLRALPAMRRRIEQDQQADARDLNILMDIIRQFQAVEASVRAERLRHDEGQSPHERHLRSITGTVDKMRTGALAAFTLRPPSRNRTDALTSVRATASELANRVAQAA